MGHLLKIVNSVAVSGNADDQLRDLLRATLSKEMFNRWNDFLEGPVADQNKKNETNLVCFTCILQYVSIGVVFVILC